MQIIGNLKPGNICGFLVWEFYFLIAVDE